jgi:hypothetical protein
MTTRWDAAGRVCSVVMGSTSRVSDVSECSMNM